MSTADIPWITIDDNVTMEYIGRVRGTNIHPSRESPSWCVAAFIVQGRRSIHLLDRDIYVSKGEFCILPSGIPHHGINADTHEAFFIHFYAKNRVIPQPSVIHTDQIYLPLIGPYPTDMDTLRFIEYIYNQRVLPYCSEYFMNTQINALFHQISLYSQKNTLWRSDHSILIAEKVMDYLQNNISKPLTYRDYEQEFEYTYKYLNSCFYRKYATTIKQMQIRLRIEQAKTLLSEGYSIEETVDICGFMDYQFFLKCFRARVGSTPGQYRKQVYEGKR